MGLRAVILVALVAVEGVTVELALSSLSVVTPLRDLPPLLLVLSGLEVEVVGKAAEAAAGVCCGDEGGGILAAEGEVTTVRKGWLREHY